MFIHTKPEFFKTRIKKRSALKRTQNGNYLREFGFNWSFGMIETERARFRVTKFFKERILML